MWCCHLGYQCGGILERGVALLAEVAVSLPPVSCMLKRGGCVVQGSAEALTRAFQNLARAFCGPLRGLRLIHDVGSCLAPLRSLF